MHEFCNSRMSSRMSWLRFPFWQSVAHKCVGVLRNGRNVSTSRCTAQCLEVENRSQQATNYGGSVAPEQGPLTYHHGNPSCHGYQNQNTSSHGLQGLSQPQFISPRPVYNPNPHIQTPPQQTIQSSHQMHHGSNVDQVAMGVDYSSLYDFGSDSTNHLPQMTRGNSGASQISTFQQNDQSQTPLMPMPPGGPLMPIELNNNRPFDGQRSVGFGDKPKRFSGTMAKRRDRIRKFVEEMNESFQDQRSHCAVAYLHPSETGRVACHLVGSQHLNGILQPGLSQKYRPLVGTVYGTVPFVGAASKGQTKAKSLKQLNNKTCVLEAGSVLQVAQADRVDQVEQPQDTVSPAVIDVGCSPISQNSLRPADDGQGVPEECPTIPKRKRNLKLGLESCVQGSNVAPSTDDQGCATYRSMAIPIDHYVQSVVNDTRISLERPSAHEANAGNTISQQRNVNNGSDVSAASNLFTENNASSTTADVISMAREAVEEEAPESDGSGNSDSGEDGGQSLMSRAKGNCFNSRSCKVYRGTMVLLDLGKEYGDHWPLVGRVKTVYVEPGCPVMPSTKIRIEWMESAADEGSERSMLAIDGKWRFWKSPSGRIYEGTYALKKHYLCNFRLIDGRLPENAKQAVNMQLNKL